MRLLSILNQVEATLAMIRPEQAAGWSRRADYQTGNATAWHPASGLTLSLRANDLGGGRHNLQAAWAGPTGAVLQSRSFYCGASSFEWQTAAEAIAEAMPETVLDGAPAATGAEPASDVRSA